MSKKNNILVITYWSFKDALIQTYTIPYLRLIRKNLTKDQKIYLVTLAQDDYKMSVNEWNKEKKLFVEENIHLIRFSYSNFGLLMMLKFVYIFLYLLLITFTKKIDYIHTWCTPAGAIGYILSLISGRKLILDSYEPHAEPMLESKTWSKKSLKFKLLFWLEKQQLKRATKVITCVDSMKDYVKEKFDVDLVNYYAKPACIDFDLFDIKKAKNQELIEKYQLKDKIVGVYAGKFEGSYLKDEVFEFLKIAEDFWGSENFRFILLTSHPVSFVQKMVAKHKLNKETIIQLFVPHHQVPAYMGLASFGISPFIPVPSKRYGTPIKNGEYWAMGLPVIITKNISDDSEIIEKEDIGYVLKDLTNKEYFNACEKIDVLIKDIELPYKIIQVAQKQRSFDIAERVYEGVYGDEFVASMSNQNVLILTYWSYKDALIQTYTLPYVRIIRRNIASNRAIYLFTLEQQFYKMTDEEWEIEKTKLLQENIHIIRFNYSNFGIKMAFRLGNVLLYLYRLTKKNNISIIHAWCMPAGALGYVLSKFTGSKLIIDSYEPHAESMVENGTWKKSSLKFKILLWLERKQSKRANTVIALTNEMRVYAAKKYTTTFEEFYIKPALVNLERFVWNKEIYTTNRISKGLNDKIVCVYAGKLGGIYLNEEVFHFFKVASDYWQEKFKVLLLTDKNLEEVNVLIKQNNIPSSCIETHYVNHANIHHYFQLADFAINFVKPVPSKRYCTSIKDGEYWALGLPVVITKDIADDSDIIKNNRIGSVLEELNEASYLKAIKDIDELLSNNSREELYLKIRPVAEKYRNFEIAEKIYATIYGN